MLATLQRSSQLGLLAKDFASARTSGSPDKRSRAVSRIVERLGLMHGLPQKLGQLLAFSDVDSSDSGYLKLTEQTLEAASEEELQALETQLGGRIDELFSKFDRRAISASIGKVWRATLKDGREVAIKSQHPGVAEAIDFDLKALGWLTRPIGGMGKGFDMQSYRNEIGDSLRSEMDYVAEARNIDEFNKRAQKACLDASAPIVLPELSGSKILTTTWLDGEEIGVAKSWTQRERDQLGETFVELFLRGLLDWKRIHADPHPGNYRFSRHGDRPRIEILDFGCVKRVSDDFSAGFAALLKIGLSGSRDRESIADCFASMGFDMDRLESMDEKIANLAEIFLEPFRANAPFEVSKWQLGKRMQSILGADRMSFRMAGSSELIFLLRSFQGLTRYLATLDAKADWRALARKVLASSATVSASPMGLRGMKSSGEDATSSRLNILVEEEGLEKARVSLGAGAIENLEDLIPDRIKQRFDCSCIDFQSVAAEARRNDYAPAELLRLNDNHMAIRVWLN